MQVTSCVSSVLSCFLAGSSLATAQIQLDSLTDPADHRTFVTASILGDPATSKLGTFPPALHLACADHKTFAIMLWYFPFPAVVFRENRSEGWQEVRVQVDSNKSGKISMDIATDRQTGLRWLRTHGDEDRWLRQMATGQTLSLQWKIYDNEDVVGVFHLGAIDSARQARLAAPWLACGKKPLW